MQTLPLKIAITQAPALPATGTDITPKSAGRLLYIDNLRWVMIMLVLSMHAAVTYSHLGNWYFMEDTPVSQAETFTFATYQVFLQSFFMGFLFFIAGYFVPKAYDTKGALRFLRDRAYRLGLPLLFFVFLLQPLSIYCIFLFDKHAPWDSFGQLYGRYLHKGWWLGGTGPLWFCEALLIFCMVYALFRTLTRKVRIARSSNNKFPAKKTIWGFIALIAGCSFLVRISWPNGTSFYNLQFCYFSQYVFFFSAGILAYRGGWLNSIPSESGRYWGRIGLIGGIIIWIAGIALGGALKGHLTPYQGGWHWQSLLECFRDQLAGTGISIFLLSWFHRRCHRQGKAARSFSTNAFAVYVFHTPVLITLSKIMISLHCPLLLKFVVLTLLSILTTYLLSAIILRRIPLLKNIL